MTEISLFDIVRPFLWVAAFAFLLGFASYFAFGGQADSAYATAEAPAASARLDSAA